MNDHPELMLENQICFRIYTLQRSVMALYKPLLDSLGITYLQYITLLVLWEKDGRTVSEICNATLLDVGTISPMLKRMERDDLIIRQREDFDERVVSISLTLKGRDLKERAAMIPRTLMKSFAESETKQDLLPPQDLALLLDGLIDTISTSIKRKK
ncbi:MAG: MarR family transcriptional regulator [Sphaerochaetaceae bacterium]|nr:MarR family transcriptional regulator [Sphaerochaetaceae bacterium]MDC7247344.1 MarR family transcriptional regulator [Sphaerochaetaceae bacterium]